MTDPKQAVLEKLGVSKKYGAICPDTVRRVLDRAWAAHPGAKAAEKAARTELHQIAGAFMTEGQLRSARADLAEYARGDEAALLRALSLHASTRERLAHADKLYDAVFSETGDPGCILDLACGLNPLHLGARGHSVVGIDIHGGSVALICDWAEAMGWDVRGEVSDVLIRREYPPARLTLLMKLLPVLDGQERGASARLLAALPSRYKLVTFPTRTLGGRQVGMERQYTQRYEPLFEDSGHDVLRRFLCGDELCYILRRADGA